MEPIVIQDVITSKEDFPLTGEYIPFRGKLHKVICTKIHLKIKKMYFINVLLDGQYLCSL